MHSYSNKTAHIATTTKEYINLTQVVTNVVDFPAEFEKKNYQKPVIEVTKLKAFWQIKIYHTHLNIKIIIWNVLP